LPNTNFKLNYIYIIITKLHYADFKQLSFPRTVILCKFDFDVIAVTLKL